MKRLASLGLAVGLLTVPLSVNAAGSGGGGSSDMPSSSAPAYDPGVEYQKGVAALRVNDFKAAERAFSRVLSVTPRDASSNYLLGLARSGQDNFKGALKAYQKAVKADPNLILARQQLALTHIRLGDADAARVERDALAGLSTACAASCPQAAELKAALATVDAALAAPPAPAASKPGASLVPAPGPLFGSAARGDDSYLAAVSLINEGRYNEAIASLEQASMALGPHPDILTYRGYVARKTGQYGVAEGFYTQALRIDPDHRGATEYYGELKVLTGDLGGARYLLARLDTICSFGCAEAEDLRRWIDAASRP